MRTRLAELGVRKPGPRPNSATPVNDLLSNRKLRLESNDPEGSFESLNTTQS